MAGTKIGDSGGVQGYGITPQAWAKVRMAVSAEVRHLAFSGVQAEHATDREKAVMSLAQAMTDLERLWDAEEGTRYYNA